MNDSTRALQEAELTSEEVEGILKVYGPHALLVGGQALATWAVYYADQLATRPLRLTASRSRAR